MPAYLIAEHKITDPKKFEEYRVKVGPMSESSALVILDMLITLEGP